MAEFTLAPSPPFRLDLTVWVLRRLPVNQMDAWDGRIYRRVLVLREKPHLVSVTQTGPENRPELLVTVGGRIGAREREEIIATLHRALGLDVDLSPFRHMAAADPLLRSLTESFEGFRPPRLPTVFEAVVNGYACQQISLAVGIQLLNRLSAAYGKTAGEQHAFPRPEDLGEAHPADVRKLGYSTRKAENILNLAKAVGSGAKNLEALNELDDAGVIDRLQELSGVGRWTAEYVALRGLGRLNVFPADDVGGQNRLKDWLGLPERPDYDTVHRILDRWSPYRGLLYFYLLLNFQKQRGFLEEEEEKAFA